MDAFLCVHSRELDFILDVALNSYRLHFPNKGRLVIVTNDRDALSRFLEERRIDFQAELSSDSEWLSKAEMELPGWFRQQVIKLRSYRFCQTANFCNLGADTLLLRPITVEDLIERDLPVLYYSRHVLPSVHWRFEKRRLKSIAGLLRVDPRMSSRFVDFINDFFCFRREWLIKLDEFMSATYGPSPYVRLLKGLDAARDQTRFGEWTLYSVFVLDCLGERPALRNARDGYLDQVHGRIGFMTSRFDSKIVHLVNKGFDRDSICRKLLRARSPIHSFA